MSDNDPGSKPRLGFIGLGGMGSRMARRLLAAGYDLTVHDEIRELLRRYCSRVSPMMRPSRK